VKTLRVLLAACLGAFFFVAVGTSGSIAAPVAAPVAPPGCPGVEPVTMPTLSISTTTPFAGQTITVAGAAFAPNRALTITLRPKSTVLANVTTAANGAFSTKVTIPANVTGTQTIATSAGASAAGCPLDPITIQIASVVTTPPTSPLGSTGVDVLTAVAVALVLICAGLMLTRGGRRHARGAHTARR
jgi:hypothetical protein